MKKRSEHERKLSESPCHHLAVYCIILWRRAGIIWAAEEKRPSERGSRGKEGKEKTSGASRLKTKGKEKESKNVVSKDQSKAKGSFSRMAAAAVGCGKPW